MKTNKMLKVISSVTLVSMLCYTLPVMAYTKEETVYSKLDASGNVYETIVSSHIKNENAESVIKDMSDLLNIENTNGYETFEKDGNTLVWNANGNDIYYQGETEKQLPVSCEISYELDGETISKDDMIGKSGRVKITLTYTNNEKHSVNINGKNETMYTPFLVIAGTIIDNEVNKNITISNGKMMDDGSKTVVVGMAFPGMQESLGIDKADFELPTKLEIMMDTTDFELDTIASFVTPKIIENKEDLEKLDKFDEVFNKVTQLQDASSSLVDGTNQLKDGAVKLNSGMSQLSKELRTTINQYENAKKQMDKETVKKQIATILKQEMNKMLPEIQEQAKIEAQNAIKRHETQLEKSVVETSMKYTKQAINDKLLEMEKNSKKVLTEEQQKQLQTAIAKDIEEVYKKAMQDPQINAYVTELVNAIKTENKKMEQGIKTEAKKQVTGAVKLKKEETSKLAPAELVKKYAGEIAKIQAIGPKNADGTPSITTTQALQMIGVVSNSTLTEVETTINSKIDTILVTNTSQMEQKIKSCLTTYINDISEQVANKFTAGNKELLAQYELNTMKQIINQLTIQLSNDQVLQSYENKIKAELNKTIDTVAIKTAQELAGGYTEMIASEIANNLIDKQLSGEAVGSVINQELKKYETLINEELAKVDTKVQKLKVALPQLADGTKQLEEGVKQLAEGMNQFNEEGIKPIYNLANGEAKDITTRAKKLGELSLEYNNYTMLEAKEEGSVQFIMLTDAIKKESKQKQDKEETILNENSFKSSKQEEIEE